MNIVHYDFSAPVGVKNNFMFLVAEEPNSFRKYCEDFFKQSQGEDGQFIFAENDKEYGFYKYGQVVFDLFSLSLQDKKIINGLYADLQNTIDEKFQQESYDLLGGIMSFFEKLSFENEMPLNYQEDLSFYDLFKAAKVQVREDFESLTEKVITYLNVVQSFTSIKIIVFVNVRCYFTDEQFKELIKHIAYLQLMVICLESVQPVRVANEKMLIIDKDFCEIIVDD